MARPRSTARLLRAAACCVLATLLLPPQLAALRLHDEAGAAGAVSGAGSPASYAPPAAQPAGAPPANYSSAAGASRAPPPGAFDPGAVGAIDSVPMAAQEDAAAVVVRTNEELIDVLAGGPQLILLQADVVLDPLSWSPFIGRPILLGRNITIEGVNNGELRARANAGPGWGAGLV
jgi:hypothetical protein